jgi:hypothetical protein
MVSDRVVPFRRREEREGARMCARGFHHWEVVGPPAYDAVGRAAIEWQCARCGARCVGPTPGAWPGDPPPTRREG